MRPLAGGEQSKIDVHFEPFALFKCFIVRNEVLRKKNL